MLKFNVTHDLNEQLNSVLLSYNLMKILNISLAKVTYAIFTSWKYNPKTAK